MLVFTAGIGASNLENYLDGLEQYYNQNYQEAIDIFDQILEKSEKSKTQLDENFKVDILFYKTLSFIKLNNILDAKENLKILEEMGYECARLYWQLGKIYLNKDNQFDNPFYSEAIKQFNKARKLGVDPTHLHRDLAISYQGLGRLEEAASEYEIALKNNGEANDYVNLAFLYKKLGDIENAIKYFGKSVELDSDLTSSYLNLGKLYLSKNEFEEAVYYLEKGVNSNPSFVAMRFELARAYFLSQNFEKAAIEFEKVIEKNKNYYRAYYYLGEIKLEHGKTQEAINMYQQSLNINTNYANAYIALGNIFLEQDNFYKAVANFSSAIDKNTINPEGHYYLALAYIKLNMKEAAIAELKTTLHLNSNYRDARELLDKLMEE
jgi:tetratricopeptide (TPR) repeat protein